MFVRSSLRRGFSLIELLIVIAILGAIMVAVAPTVRDLRERSALRSARGEVIAALAAAQEAALQKGKVATLEISGSTLIVHALSGLTGNRVTMLGPIPLDRQFGATITPIAPAPALLNFDARGLVTPATTQTHRYVVTIKARADTICVSGGGLVLPKGCVL